MRCRDRRNWWREDREAHRRQRESMPYSPSRLYRIPEQGMIKGVCAGIAEYFGIDPLIVRIVAVVALFMFPLGALIGYFIAIKVVPPRPVVALPGPDEEKFWTGVRTAPERTLSALRHRFRELELRLRTMEAHVTSPGFSLGREIDDLDR